MAGLEEIVREYNQIHIDDYLEKDVEKIYHYTSPEGLMGIIDKKALYATDLFYMNDKSEGVYVLELIKDNINELCTRNEQLKKCVKNEIEKIEKQGPDPNLHGYSVSFSMNPDSLEMWNYYTKGNSVQGYAVGFQKEMLSQDLRIRITNDKKTVVADMDNQLKLYHGKIIYSVEKQLEAIKSIFALLRELSLCENGQNDWEYTAHLIVRKLYFLGGFFKKPCFEVEAEYRMVYITTLAESKGMIKQGIPFKECFRIKNGIFIPYQECEYEYDDIKEIVFAPTLLTRNSEKSLERMLRCYKINAVLKDSEIPLRW